MTLTLDLLGTFDVRRDDHQVGDFRSQRARALLAYLAIEADRPHEREHLCAMLWPDEPLQAALTNLRQMLHRLREAIEPPGEEGRYLLITRQSVRLNAAGVRSDVAIFYGALALVDEHRHRAASSCAACVARMRAALELWRGELLPGFSTGDGSRFEEWLQVERERAREGLFRLLNTLAAHHERRGEQGAAALLRRWLALEPWNEDAHLRLVAALARAGQRTLALRQFERYRQTIAADFGAEPGPAALRLREQVRAGELVGPAAVALRGAPTGGSPFVGREHELAALVEHLGDPARRLVTLVGMGGHGKTRLAVEAAAEAAYAFAGGAAFVGLSSLTRADELPEALAAALRLTPAPGRPLIDQVLEQLCDGERLLVLDNCEQVAGLGEPVARLLAEAPGLTILATARAPLGLRAEWLVPVEGLELGVARGAEAPDPAAYAAGRLFLQVARQVRPELRLGREAAGLIHRCCALLHGGPLAIELAATQLREHTLVALVAMVGASCASLATQMADVLPRHRSLRAVFDWSWGLLDATAQATLARVAVFRGGFDHAAALAVGGSPEALERLARHSLIKQDDQGRYAIHEQIRQFAAERLAQRAETSQASAAHAAHYLGVAAASEALLDGPDSRAAIAALRAEHDNLRQAWAFATSRADHRLLGAAAPAYGQLYARSNLREGIAQLRAALEACDPAAAPADYRRLLDALVGQLIAAGRADEGQARGEELLALARATGDRLGEAGALLYLGDLATGRRGFAGAWGHFAAAGALSAGDPTREAAQIHAGTMLRQATLIDVQQLPVDRNYAEAAYELFRELGMSRMAGVALNRLGNQHRRAGDYGRSLEARLQAVAMIEAQGDLELGTGVLNDLGEVYLLLGRYALAREVFEQALVIAERIGLRRAELVLREGLGRTLFHLGELHAAEAQIELALALDAVSGGRAQRGYYLATLGYAAEAGGRHAAAAEHYAGAVSWWEGSGSRSDAVVEPLAGLARVALAQGRIGEAIGHVEAVLPHLAGGLPQDALEPLWAHLSCYRVLRAAGDARASGVLAAARALLEAQAAAIGDPALRESFLGVVAAHRAIRAEAGLVERSLAA